MLNERDYKLAQGLKTRLEKITPILAFRVFGSRARGDYAEDSDLDVFIEIKETQPATLDAISDAVWEMGFHHHTVISPVIFSQFELEHTPLRSSPLVKNILGEGIAL
jgi:predicted nucleotidyltransferase